MQQAARRQAAWRAVTPSLRCCCPEAPSHTPRRPRTPRSSTLIPAAGKATDRLLGVQWYVLLLFLRVLLSWFPTFKWEGQPWLAVRQLTDPYLNIFRNIIPPLMGVMDFTPLLGFVILQNLQGWLQKVSKAPGEFDW